MLQGQSSEKIRSALTLANIPKWESPIAPAQWEGARPEISSGPLLCHSLAPNF